MSGIIEIARAESRAKRGDEWFELRAALDRAIAAAEFEEAEVRGKGAVPSLVRAA